MYTVVTANNCTFCQKAKSALSVAGLAFTEVELTKTKWALTLVKKAGLKTVPQIFDGNGQHIGGYTELIEHLSLT